MMQLAKFKMRFIYLLIFLMIYTYKLLKAFIDIAK